MIASVCDLVKWDTEKKLIEKEILYVLIVAKMYIPLLGCYCVKIGNIEEYNDNKCPKLVSSVEISSTVWVVFLVLFLQS